MLSQGWPRLVKLLQPLSTTGHRAALLLRTGTHTPYAVTHPVLAAMRPKRPTLAESDIEHGLNVGYEASDFFLHVSIPSVHENDVRSIASRNNWRSLGDSVSGWFCETPVDQLETFAGIWSARYNFSYSLQPE